jgi:cytochrome P450
MIFYLAFAPVVVFTFYRTFHLAKNYIAARKLGLPIILLPVSSEDIWWIPLRPFFSFVQKLPFGLGTWYIYTELGWPMVDSNRTILKLGENFVLCSPACNMLATSYPPALEQRAFGGGAKTWSAPEAQSQIFAFYGQNVSSTNGVEWQRHRKITTGAFNERSMARVWDESIKRVQDLKLEEEEERSLGRIRKTFDLFAMHVLAAVFFGQENATLEDVPTGHKESLMDSLGFILKNVTLVLVFGKLSVPDFLLPNVLRRLKTSVAEFKLYMQELVLTQMQLSGKSEESRQTRSTSLLSALVTANETEKALNSKSYLTESELYGNLFVFNLAGYETTAGTLTFALPYLAAHPEVQAWVAEEVDALYTSSRASGERKDYAAVYPKLIRCLSVLYETLRLANPAPLLVWTPSSSQQFLVNTKDGEKMVTVEPDMLVGMHNYGAHLSPRWGNDVKEFNPQRFVSTSFPTTNDSKEKLVVPGGVGYIPWTAGPRICPGKKFSEVEFVATIAAILSSFKIEVVKQVGESDAGAKAKTLAVLDEKVFNISAHLKRPEDATIRFVRR